MAPALNTPTFLGAIFVPLALLVAMVKPKYLIGIAIVAAVFQGGSILNFETRSGTIIPIIPFYFLEAVIAVVLLFHLPRGLRAWRRLERASRAQLALLIAFGLWCLITTVLLTELYRGLLVDRPRAGLDAGYFHLEPLRFSLSNLAQLGYLLLNVVLLLWCALAAARWDFRLSIRRFFGWATALVIALGLYQGLGFIFGWPFPFRAIDSNPVVLESEGYRQIIAVFGRRVSSTFSEPSFASAFLATAALYYVVLSVRSSEHRGRRLLLAVLAAVVLLWTGASTGYVTLAAGAALFVGAELAPVFRGRLRASTLLLLGGAGIVAVVGAVVFWNPHWTAILNAVVFEKQLTASAVRRFAANRVAWGLFLHTWGLGVGLGSERPSSLILYLLANVGIVGSLLFGAAAGSALKAIHDAKKHFASAEERAQLSALAWAFGANFIALALSIPDLTWGLLWVIWAMIIVSCQPVSRSAAPSASGPVAVWRHRPQVAALP